MIAGFTLPQIFVLLLVLTIGAGSVAWMAARLFGPGNSAAILSQAVTPEIPGQAAAESPTVAPEPPQELLLAPFDCAAQNSGAELAGSARVIDARTLEVEINGETRRIELAGLAFPEDGAHNSRAVEIAANFVAAPPLLLVRDIAQQDEDGRLARYVFSGDRFLNLDLVRLGLAQADPTAPDRSCLALFQQAEQQARAERIGIWQPTAVPTATFMPFVTLDSSREAPCDCSSRPTCADFETQSEAQACYNACNDYNSRLDLDRDGLACEELYR